MSRRGPKRETSVALSACACPNAKQEKRSRHRAPRRKESRRITRRGSIILRYRTRETPQTRSCRLFLNDSLALHCRENPIDAGYNNLFSFSAQIGRAHV